MSERVCKWCAASISPYRPLLREWEKPQWYAEDSPVEKSGWKCEASASGKHEPAKPSTEPEAAPAEDGKLEGE